MENKHYAVVCQNRRTKKVSMDIYCAESEDDARRYCNEYHRHGDYLILSVAEIPD